MDSVKFSFIYLISFIVIVFIILFSMIAKNRKDIYVNYVVSGNIENVGCLSVYIDDLSGNNEYSFDNGNTWQKSKYGIIYGNTTVLVKNSENEVIYRKEIKNDGFNSQSPLIKIDSNNIIDSKSNSGLLKGIEALSGEQNISSNVIANVVEENNDNLLVSYYVGNNDGKCYALREVVISTNTNVNVDTNVDVNPNDNVDVGQDNPIPIVDEWIWPTNKPYYISSGYGKRWGRIHNGVDIAGQKRGSKIYAARAGEVVDVGSNSSSGYYVTIKHDNGYYTRYAHMQNMNGNDRLGKISSATKYVAVGKRVAAHDVIGEIGSSGNSTGLHCHFEIWSGVPYKSKSYNPLTFY